MICRLPWAKNVNEERDSPPQVLIGANDPRYDILSDIEFVFCVDCEDYIRDVLGEILKSEDFIIRDITEIGTHSIRKFAVTFGHGNRCRKV